MFELPLFPLHMVLFPGAPFQLRIFEERYKKMVHFCQKTISPFGVVLIHHGVEANGPLPSPYSYGCMARITHLEPLEEGQFNLYGVGQERFHIKSLRYDRPYLVGKVETFPLEQCDPQAMSIAVGKLRPLVSRYLHVLAKQEDADVEDVIQQMPDDPMVFAYLGAVVVQVPLSQKQSLLQIKECLGLLEQLQNIFRRELALLGHIQEKPPSDRDESFSRN